MSNSTDRDYLDELASHLDDTDRSFSNERKPERERSACAALLRRLGIDFSPNEIESFTDEPPDVVFRNARFEVLEIPDEDRRRHDEIKEKIERCKCANTIDDVTEPAVTTTPLSYGEVISLVTNALNRKAQGYGKIECGRLDALVYVNLIKNYLDPDSPFPNLDVLCSQGWRSVSLLIEPFGRVLCAEPSAPPFLLNIVGQTKNEWKSPGSFEL